MSTRCFVTASGEHSFTCGLPYCLYCGHDKPAASVQEAPPEKTRRQHIIDQLTDGIADLLYYDRKEDEDLPHGAIEAAVQAGEITVQEIVTIWSDELRDGLRQEITSREIEKLKDFN